MSGYTEYSIVLCEKSRLGERFSPDSSGYTGGLSRLQGLGLRWRAEQATHQTLATALLGTTDSSGWQD